MTCSNFAVRGRVHMSTFDDLAYNFNPASFPAELVDLWKITQDTMDVSVLSFGSSVLNREYQAVSVKLSRQLQQNNETIVASSLEGFLQNYLTQVNKLEFKEWSRSPEHYLPDENGNGGYKHCATKKWGNFPPSYNARETGPRWKMIELLVEGMHSHEFLKGSKFYPSHFGKDPAMDVGTEEGRKLMVEWLFEKQFLTAKPFEVASIKAPNACPISSLQHLFVVMTQCSFLHGYNCEIKVAPAFISYIQNEGQFVEPNAMVKLLQDSVGLDERFLPDGSNSFVRFKEHPKKKEGEAQVVAVTTARTEYIECTASLPERCAEEVRWGYAYMTVARICCVALHSCASFLYRMVGVIILRSVVCR